jgi:hypothetical protein
MIRRFARTIGLLTMLGILYSGPVVACVCPDHMPAMPCCPEDNGAGYAKMATDAYAACDPVSADLLAAETPDPPAPTAIVEAPRPPSVHVLPPARISVSQQPYAARPIYLVTERRRE